MSGPSFPTKILPHSSVSFSTSDVNSNKSDTFWINGTSRAISNVPHLSKSPLPSDEVSTFKNRMVIRTPSPPLIVLPEAHASIGSVEKTTLKNSFISKSPLNSSSNVISSHIPEKKIEQGLIQFFSPSKFVCYFETIPFWIFSLHASFCDEINFPEFTDFESLSSCLEKPSTGRIIVLIMRVHFELSAFSFGTSSTLNSNTITLINGSIPFAENIIFVKNILQAWLFVSDSVVRYRKLPSSTLDVHRARHLVFGGPTTAETLWASSIHSFAPTSTSMRRNIGDFVKYAIRPSPVDMPPPPYAVHFESLLPIGKLSNPIVYPSTFTRTGYGQRALSNNELSFVFGFSSEFADLVEENIFPVPPVQVSSSLLKQFLGCLDKPSNVNRNASLILPTPLPVPDTAVTYLEKLKIVLPPTWKQDKLSTEKTAKSDDAEVDYSLWNDRILALWPMFGPALTSLRSLVMRYQKRKLFLEFCAYLHDTYGQVYEDYLEHYFLLYKGLFIFKRAEGVLFKESSALVRKSSFDSQKSPFSKETILSNLKTKRFSKLLQDIRYGTQALQSYLGADYFSWNKGSTLLFWR